MNKRIVFLIGFIWWTKIFAGEFRWGSMLSNNAVSFPITGTLQNFTAMHPGVDVFLEQRLNKHSKNQFWLTYNAGIYYHRFFQTGIRLYGGFEYRRLIGTRFFLHGGLLLGYLHSLSDYDKFELNTNGTYEKIPNWYGRSQFLIGLGLGVSYAVMKKNPDGLRVQFMLRSFLQGPFAGSYIPILPTNSLMLGFTLPICKKSKNSN